METAYYKSLVLEIQSKKYLLEKSQVTVNGLLAIFGLVLLGGLGESLLLGREPVLVESAADFVGETGSPDGLDGAWSVWGVDVTGDTDDLNLALKFFKKYFCTLSGGVSMMVTGSTTSFLLMAEPGFSASRTTWVIPALKPMKAVK